MYHERRAGTLIFFFFSLLLLPSRILKGSSSHPGETFFTRCEFFLRGRDIISLPEFAYYCYAKLYYRDESIIIRKGSVSSFIVSSNYP